MRDDRELFYAAGEMTDAERQAFEASAGSEALMLKDAFAHLKHLNSTIPDPQISFARIQNAIEAAPAPRPVFAWRRWLTVAAPIGVIAMAAFLLSSRLPETSSIVPEGSIAVVTPDLSPKIEPRLPVAGTSVAPPPITEELAPVVKAASPPSSRIRPSFRRRPARLMAKLDRELPSASEGLPKFSPRPAGVALTSADPAAESMGNSFDSATPPASEPIVVVVTSSQDAQTGANTAMEVSKQSDIVLGG